MRLMLVSLSFDLFYRGNRNYLPARPAVKRDRRVATRVVMSAVPRGLVWRALGRAPAPRGAPAAGPRARRGKRPPLARVGTRARDARPARPARARVPALLRRLRPGRHRLLRRLLPLVRAHVQRVGVPRRLRAREDGGALGRDPRLRLVGVRLPRPGPAARPARLPDAARPRRQDLLLDALLGRQPRD